MKARLIILSLLILCVSSIGLVPAIASSSSKPKVIAGAVGTYPNTTKLTLVAVVKNADSVKLIYKGVKYKTQHKGGSAIGPVWATTTTLQFQSDLCYRYKVIAKNENGVVSRVVGAKSSYNGVSTYC